MRKSAEYLTVAQQAVEIGYELMTTADRGAVHHKGDRDLVTDLDLRIQQEIRDYLGRATPEAAFLGEEQGAGVIDPDAECIWVLDPIDGTSNFAHSLPLCATSLALVSCGAPIVGAIVAPFLNLHYHAAKNEGAYVNGRRMRTGAATDISRAIVSIGDYATGLNAQEKNRHRLAVTQALATNVERVRMFGSAALDLAWVAEGRTDACVILANKPWDTAAGVLLVREAGKKVLDTNGAEHSLGSATTIASESALIEQLLSVLPVPHE